MRVLIACETSGVTREAFRRLGHEAWSCDLLPADDGRLNHYQEDVRICVWRGWDLMIAHPPCTHLAVSGARWFKDKTEEQAEALDLVRFLMFDSPIERWCIENPVSIISSQIRKPDQIIQPWMFGHEASKRTCLWLKNLQPLKPTNIVDKGPMHITKSGKKVPAWYNLPDSKRRWKIRSKTFEGIADAMAEQWS